MPHPPADRERRPERRFVEQAERGAGAAELDRAGDGDLAQPGRIEIGPACHLEPRRERVVAVVEPGSELGLARWLPVADRGSHGLGEEPELVRHVEPHPSAPSTASVSAPSAGGRSR